MEEHLVKTLEAYSQNAQAYETKVANLHHAKEGQFFMANLPAGGKILDAGCADGRDCRIFSERGFKVTGIDLTLEFLEIARKKVPLGNFSHMDMRQLDFEDNYFDGVWSCASAVHMDSEGFSRFLSETKRVLKPYGILYLAVKEGSGQVVSGSKNFFLYTAQDIKKLLDSSGLYRISVLNEVVEMGGKSHGEVRAFARKYNSKE